MATTVEKKTEIKGRSLIDLIFSWSIADVLNKDLYKYKVGEIPKTFTSTSGYMESFKNPVVEETHADLFSSMTTVSRAPACEIVDVKTSKDYKPPKNLFYEILLRRSRDTKKGDIYEPEVGDLIALTDVRPKCIDDLNRPKRPYLIALVQRANNENADKLRILSSEHLLFEKKKGKEDKEREKLFAVYLTNLTTNIRIWSALNSELEGGSMNIIKNLLGSGSTVNADCTLCSSEENTSAAVLNSMEIIQSFGLDDSQKSAVSTCIATRECHHQNTVKLIWGPPGTGKTKTVASLLFTLLMMKCRTLTCAPTNIAVLGVTQRLMGYMRASLDFDTYGLGDIVLFGNGERMKIDDHEDLYDVFLDYRVHILASCLVPLSGWRDSVNSMISLLEHPAEQYKLYLKKQEQKDDSDNSNGSEENDQEGSFGDGNSDRKDNKDGEIDGQDVKDVKKTEIWKKFIVQTIKESKKKKKQTNVSSEKKGPKKCDKNESKNESVLFSKKEGGTGDKNDNLWTFEEFVTKSFNSIGKKLIFCITGMYTHLPTSLISLQTAKKMIKAVDLLQIVGSLLHRRAVANEGLREALKGIEDVGKGMRSVSELHITKAECLKTLRHIRKTLSVPDFTDHYVIRSFCLQNARLLFCTASSSAKLHTEGMTPIELLVIDEAAQLKECESTIPLQLSGLGHAILIGDEKQLPAMVQSKICEKAEFGRSLFERMVLLGHSKQLLRVQYRMHPSISLFPNREFYDKNILDGPNVKRRDYQRRFLQGSMFGTYSFINVAHGKEEFDDRRSRKNTVEAFLVAEIVARLHKESIATKQRVRVGCISPYKAQVFAIQEILGKTYSAEADNDFSVNVRSVDGFQGGEEDVIIISTVRCNGTGSVGFLDNRQRANVALTRARHCLWILGNATTLVNSGCVWKNLVNDAKSRRCFHNAIEDGNLAEAVTGALVEFGQLNALLHTDSLLFKTARWKVHFSDDFLRSISRIKNKEIHKAVLSLLTKIASGWRQHRHSRILIDMGGNLSDLLELYDINGLLNLIWMVDIVRENSKYIQVLKICDILPASEIPKVTTRLDDLFGNYTVSEMNHCKFKRVEGNLVIPETWPLDANAVRTAPLAKADRSRSRHLSSQFASLNLRDDTGPSTRSHGNHRKHITQRGAKASGMNKR